MILRLRKSASAFRKKLISIWLNLPLRTFQRTAAITKSPTAAVVVGHHRVEPVHIGVDVVVDRRLRAVHADVFSQAISNLRRREDEVLPDRGL